MPNDLAGHHFWVYASLGGVIGEKMENFALKSDYKIVFGLQAHLFYQLLSLKPPYNVYLIMLPNWYLWGTSWKLNKPLFGLLDKQFGHSMLIMAKISYFSNEI